MKLNFFLIFTNNSVFFWKKKGFYYGPSIVYPAPHLRFTCGFLHAVLSSVHLFDIQLNIPATSLHKSKYPHQDHHVSFALPAERPPVYGANCAAPEHSQPIDKPIGQRRSSLSASQLLTLSCIAYLYETVR